MLKYLCIYTDTDFEFWIILLRHVHHVMQKYRFAYLPSTQQQQN
jgi:hypothetical protein